MAKLPYETAESIVEFIPSVVSTSGGAENDNAYFDISSYFG